MLNSKASWQTQMLWKENKEKFAMQCKKWWEMKFSYWPFETKLTTKYDLITSNNNEKSECDGSNLKCKMGMWLDTNGNRLIAMDSTVNLKKKSNEQRIRWNVMDFD